VTSIVGGGGTTATRRQWRRLPLARAAAVVVGLAAITFSSSAVHADQGNGSAPKGFASQDGTEVEMLRGPTCHEGEYHMDEVCEPAADDWWADAPVITSAPKGTLTLRWETPDAPVEVGLRTESPADSGDGPSMTNTLLVSTQDCGNPCQLDHVDVTTNGVTYLLRVYWEEGTYKSYAFTLKPA
jgi:hypothetical protein